MDRNSKLFTELELYTIHQNLTKELIGNEIGLLPHSLEVESQFVDSTCIEANIHHPTDWVCLKDFCFSVLNSIEVIRKYNILNRLPKEIKEFKRELNQLCIGMAHARRSKEMILTNDDRKLMRKSTHCNICEIKFEDGDKKARDH